MSDQFPLHRHKTGQWAKKIRGRRYYFGTDRDTALAKYLEQKEALETGRNPRQEAAPPTVKDVCNAFLNAKRAKVDCGELAHRTWVEYKAACDEVVAAFRSNRQVEDLTTADFALLRVRMAGKWGPVRLGKVVQYVRGVFKYAYDSGLLEKPVRTGPDFRPPTQKVLRLHKARRGPKLFTAQEILRCLGAASTPHLKAMILLGINCGFGNADCAHLPQSALDLEGGWVTYPRPKTGFPRRCALWPETVAAIKEALAKRHAPEKPEHAGLVFLSRYGRPWAKDNDPGPLSKIFAELLHKLGINGRNGLGFYSLRHTYRTVADEAKDQPAADFTMGHIVAHMSSVYRERISDERLRAVSGCVQAWLFGGAVE
jgi:integrase